MFNLEIDGVHRYYVSEAEVLVHNATQACPLARLTLSAPNPAGGLSSNEAAFRDFVLDDKTQFQIYRAGDGGGLGDFVLVYGNKASAVAVELKNPASAIGYAIKRVSSQISSSQLAALPSRLVGVTKAYAIELSAASGFRGVDVDALFQEITQIASGG